MFQPFVSACLIAQSSFKADVVNHHQFTEFFVSQDSKGVRGRKGMCFVKNARVLEQSNGIFMNPFLQPYNRRIVLGMTGRSSLQRLLQLHVWAELDRYRSGIENLKESQRDKLARFLVRVDHIARFIVNANHCIM